MKYERNIRFPVKRFSRNLIGRDFIVADLHACRAMLEDALALVGFDPSRDRLFSVGDLVDRGPNSFWTLCLIEEPWFHFVIANHEAMLLTFLNVRGSDYHSARDFIHNGGGWIDALDAQQRSHLREVLLPILENAPLVMMVDDDVCPFNVLHAEAVSKRDHVLTDAEFSDDDEVARITTPLTWGRRLVYQGHKALDEDSVVSSNGIMIAEPAMREGLSLTYVGHTILEQKMLHKSHLFMDCGAYVRQAGNDAASLSLMNHRDVVRSLRACGVAL